MAAAMRIASPTKASAWRSCSCSSISASAGRSPHSLFHHRPDPKAPLNSPLEAAYHKADAAIADIVHLLKAA
jgi:hypothetical protein